MNVFTTAIRVAAVHRMTQLVVDDEIMRPVREGVSERWPGSKAEYLVGCPACVSVWAAFAALILPAPVLYALALSAGTLGIKWAAEVAEAAATGRNA